MNMEEEKEESRHQKKGPRAASAWHSLESRAEEGEKQLPTGSLAGQGPHKAWFQFSFAVDV